MLIIAVLASAASVIALFITFPLSMLHMVVLALLGVSVACAIVAIIRSHKKSQLAQFDLLSIREALERKLDTNHEEDQALLVQLEDSLQGVQRDISGKLDDVSRETASVASEMAVTTNNMSTILINQSNSIRKLEQADQSLERRLTSLVKELELFRSDFTGQFKNLSSDSGELVVSLGGLTQLTSGIESEIKAQQDQSIQFSSLLRETSSMLQTLQQECQEQFDSQNTEHSSLLALLEENVKKLTTVKTQNTKGFKAQKEASAKQQDVLGRVEQMQHDLHLALDQSLVKIGDDSMAISTAIENLTSMNTTETEKHHLACEILSQLIAENDTSIGDLHKLMTRMKDDSSQEFSRQAEVLTALDSKVGSQQNAVVAAMKQVEHSHRPQGRLEGDLSNLSLPDLLQILQLAKKTASIILKDINGSLYLEKGMLVYVRQGKFAGIQAFIRIMMLERGYFSVRFDVLPNSLPKKTRALIPELLTVIAEVDEIKERVSTLRDTIQKESNLDHVLIQLPAEGVEQSVLQTFNHQAPASLDELVVFMGKGVQENISLLEELYETGDLILSS